MASVLSDLNAQLARLEAIPLSSNIQSTDRASVKLGEKTFSVELSYSQWTQKALETFQEFRRKLIFERLTSQPETVKIDRELVCLQRNALSLIYRTKEALKLSEWNFKPVRPESKLRTDLTQLVERYKRNPDLYPGGEGHLTPIDREQITYACNQFPLAVEALLQRNTEDTNNDRWTTAFIKFCFRSPGASQISASHWIDIFFELPNETDDLMSHTFDKRFGAVDPSMLKMRIVDGTKALYMKISKQWVKTRGNAAKQAQVTLTSLVNKDVVYKTTIEDIYAQMRSKKTFYNNFEVVESEGLANWHTAQLGSYNPSTKNIDQIDVSQRDWIYALPVWKSLDLEHMQARYPGQLQWPHDLQDADRFALVMCATRETPNKDIARNHAFFELVIPEPGSPGKFRILPFGFQPPVFPETDVDQLVALQSTRPCILHYPDESSVLSQRQRDAECYIISREEFETIQLTLLNFVTKSREGKEVFQTTGSNCGKHVQKFYDDTIGQRFYKPFADLAKRAIPGQESRIQTQLKQITKGLNEDVLEALSTELSEALVLRHSFEEMGQLLALCFSTLSYSLKEGLEIQEMRMTAEEAQGKIVALYDSSQDQTKTDALLKADLKELMKLAIVSQQFYKTSVYDMEINVPLIGSVYRAVVSIRWEWLRKMIFKAFCLLLGSWRALAYKKQNGTMKKARISNHPLHGRVINLPAKMFDRPKEKKEYLRQAQAIKARLSNL